MAAAGTSFLDIWLYGDFREKRPAGEVSPTMPYFSPGPWVTQPGERLLINSCFLFFFYSSLFPPPLLLFIPVLFASAPQIDV